MRRAAERTAAGPGVAAAAGMAELSVLLILPLTVLVAFMMKWVILLLKNIFLSTIQK